MIRNYTNLTKVHFAKNQRFRRHIFRIFLPVLAVGMVVLYFIIYFMLKPDSEKAGALITTQILPYVSLTVSGIYGLILGIDKLLFWPGKEAKRRSRTYYYTVTPECIEVILATYISTVTATHPFDNFIAATEEGNTFYLYTKNVEFLPIDKNGFTEGTAEELRVLLALKFGDRFEQIKP